MRSVLLVGTPTPSSMPHGSAVYQQRRVPLPALRHHMASGHHLAPLLSRPQSPGRRRGPHARALMRSLWLIRRDRYRRVHYHSLHPLSEEKAVRSLYIHIVTQKNQKKMETIA